MVIEKRPVSGDKLRQIAEERRRIDFQGSTMFEELLQKKKITYHKDGLGLYQMGSAGSNELVRADSVSSLDGYNLFKTLEVVDATGIDYYAKLFMSPSVIEKWTDEELNKLYQRVRLTLKSTMKLLLLRNEFYHID